VGYNPAPRSSPEKKEIIFLVEKFREQRRGEETAEDLPKIKSPKRCSEF
jgi:hypothetical protein